MATGVTISVVILFIVYLYTQARRKAEQVFTGTATTLEGEIAALSGEMRAHKQSLAAEMHDTKEYLLKMQKDFIDSQRWEISSLKTEIDAQKGELAALKGEMAGQRRVVDDLSIWRSDFCEVQKGNVQTQKGELAALKGEMGAQKFTLQGDITKILAWLGRNPYLPNPAVAAATANAFAQRLHPQHRVPTSILMQQRDIYEAAMRKQFETAGL